MIPEGMHYRATRDLYVGTARAYSTGDLVHESAVEGPDAWLSVGADVEPVAGVRLGAPARNASQAQWAAYMASAGMDADEAQGMSRAQLLEAYDAANAPPGTSDSVAGTTESDAGPGADEVPAGM